jgi:hypothetical protein
MSHTQHIDKSEDPGGGVGAMREWRGGVLSTMGNGHCWRRRVDWGWVCPGLGGVVLGYVNKIFYICVIGMK